MRKPRTIALPAGSPLAAGAAAAHHPPRPIQPGGRAKQRERDQQPPDRREPDAARGYVHALTWSSGTITDWSTAAHRRRRASRRHGDNAAGRENARSCSLQQEG